MRRVIIYEAIILAVMTGISLPLMFSTENYAGHNIVYGNASKSVAFNLQKGQTVDCSFDYDGDTNGAWFALTDGQGDELNASSILGFSREGGHGASKFIAQQDGAYYLFIWNTYGWGHNVYYQYSVTPSIEGFNPTIVVLTTVASGIALSLATALSSLRHRKTLQRGQQA